MKRGFTLAELLMVVIVVGILAAIAVPSYTKILEKTAAKQAIDALKRIRAAQKVYFASHSGAYACPIADDCHQAEIKSVLGVDVVSDTYTFWWVGATASPVGFIAKAQRLDGAHHVSICLDQNGTWTGDDPYAPGTGVAC
ncbi:MAG TPA: prepilin-type N-terminal cleavage/methylation domain-containing protein [Candidatus Omnitrophota bacterium]|nr:prepilin-type N-terminal cleavage/methylation domain-containing protein [Candidatus Omnitrophota bacterium]HPS36419.1 prepilin-type N-terminal cleavage/methylation domain-containing protein [Candidatus Omnitrophota bacterium]